MGYSKQSNPLEFSTFERLRRISRMNITIPDLIFYQTGEMTQMMYHSNRIKKNIPHQPGAIDGWNRTLGQEILMPREIVRDKLELSVNRHKVRILSLCHIDGRNRLTFKILNLCHEEHLCTSMVEIGHRDKNLSLCHDRWILRSWGSVITHRLSPGNGNSMVIQW